MNHYSFEKLTVWQQARQLALLIYGLTRTFPSEEKFGIVRQLRRSAISVCSNIAEGSTRWSKRIRLGFMRFLMAA
jgi:four helix bundle protein